MRCSIPFLVHALLLPLAAAEATPLAQQVQRSLRLPVAGLRQIEAELAALPEKPEKPEKGYWQALVIYALLGQTQDPRTGATLLAAATNRLEGRADADSLALEGSLCGMAISLHPEQAMSLVARAMACFERAKRLAPANPRVRFFEAVHVFQTPEAFGGGPAAALPLLEAATAMAEAESAPANPWSPAWGRTECLAWLALAEAKDARMASARAHLDRCFRLDPDYGFARATIAPLVK